MKFSEGDSARGVREARRVVYLWHSQGSQKPMIFRLSEGGSEQFLMSLPAEYLEGKIVLILIEKDTK